MMLIEARRLFNVLYFDFFDKYVRYRETILGSVGMLFIECLEQNREKSLKSDLYARIVFFAFDSFKLSKVLISKFLISVVKLFIISDNH